MSISVTVSGQDSTSVVSAQPLSNTITVSGISSEVQVTRASQNAATITVSTGDPITVTSNQSNQIYLKSIDLSSLNTATGLLNVSTGLLSASTGNLDSKITRVSGLLAASDVDLNPLNIATGVLKNEILNVSGLITSNDSDITSLNSATGFLNSSVNSLNTATGLLTTATGNLDAKIITVSGLIVSNDIDLTALNTATGLLNAATGSLKFDTSHNEALIFSNASDISSLRAVTGDLFDATGFLNTATGVLSTATGNLDSKIITISGLINSNDADLTALNIATGFLNTNVIGLQTATGSLKSDISSNDSDISSLQIATGLILTSGEIDTNINIAIANLVSGAPSTLNTLNELASALGDDANFSTTIATSLGNLSTATGDLDSKIIITSGALNSQIITVSENLKNTGANVSTATGALNVKISTLETATGLLLQKSETGDFIRTTGTFAEQGRDCEFAGGTFTETMLITAPNSDIGLNIQSPNNKVSFINFGDFDLISGGAIRYDNPSDSFQIRTSGDEALNINTSGDVDIVGKVGIGTSSPQAKLHVNGNTILSGVLTVTGNINSPNVLTASSIVTGLSTFGVLNVTGNVGIGTTSPSGKLHVDGDTILSGVLTVTGNINSPTITALDAETQSANAAISNLELVTGLLVKKLETGVLLTSGEIQTNIDAAVANLVDSAPATLNTLNELAAALGDDANFSTTTASSLGNLSTATGVLNTNVNALQAVSGSFAQTGSTQNATFNEIFLHGDLRFKDPTEGIIFTNNAGVERFGLKVGDSGALGGSNNIMLTNREATGNLLFGTAGIVGGGAGETERMRITHDGKVGIGTLSPSGALDVVGTQLIRPIAYAGNQDSAAISFAASNNSAWDNLFGIRFATDSNGVPSLKLRANGNDKLIVKQNGIGIGTTTPRSDLDVSGSVISNKTLAVEGQDNPGTNGPAAEVQYRSSDNAGRFYSYDRSTSQYKNVSIGDDYIYAKNDGNVGIGTTSPDTQLHVKSTGSVALKLEADTDNIDETHNPLIQFIQDSSLISANIGFNGNDDHSFTGAINNAFYIETTPAAASFGAFQIANNNQAHFTLDNNGNIGIGTTSPSTKLEVGGDTILNGHVGIGVFSPQFPLDIGGTNSSTGSTIRIGQNNGGTAIRIGAGGGSSDVVLMRVDGQGDNHDGATNSGAFGFSMKYMGSLSQNANALRIISDNQEGTAVNALNILQDGSIGLNTTSPAARLHVNGDTILSGNLTITGASSLANNLVVEGTIQANSGRLILHDVTQDSDKVIKAASNNLTFLNVHGVFGNSVGIRSDRGNVRGMDQGSNSSDLGLFCNSIEGISIQDDGDVIVGNGNVGIGTTTPSEALDVSGNILSNGIIKAFNITAGVAQLEVGRDGNQYLEAKVTDPDVFIVAHQDSDSNGNHHFVLDREFDGTGANDFEIRKGGSAQVIVNTDGRVGIGTTSPQAPLDVADDSNIQLRLRSTTSSNNTRMSFSPNNIDTWNIGINYVSNDFTFYDAANNTTPVRFEDGATGDTLVVDSNSRVGIGTASPNEQLHVEDSSSSNGTSLTIQNAFGESPKNIKFRYSDAAETARIEGFGRNNTSNLPYLAFHVNQTTSSSASNNVAERMRITSSGNVGIGTTTPSQALDVAGNIRLASSLPKIMLVDTDSDSDFQISNTNGRFSIYDLTNNENRVIIKSDGSVGIGIDPQALLHISGDGPNQFRFDRAGHDSIRMGCSHAAGFSFHNITDSETLLFLRDNGNIGIGGIGGGSVTAKLHVSGGDFIVQDSARSLTYDVSANQLNAAGATFEINKSNGVDVAIGNDDFYVDMSTSRVGIGTRTPSEALDVDGNISASGNLKVDGSQVDFTNLPTSDPGVAGRLYNHSGIIKISL